MKIAMIGQKGIPVTSGGIERHVEEICKRLAQRGHDVTVYNRQGYQEYDGGEYCGIRLKTTFTVNNRSLEAMVYSFLASINAVFKGYDIVHYHALGPSVMSFIPRIFGKKVIVTVHGLDWQRKKWGRFARLYLKLGERISAYVPHKTVTVSDKLKKHYLSRYGKEAVFIPNGILKPDEKQADIIKRYGLDKNNYILFLARLVPEKGCHYLLKAFDKIDTGIKLVIAGGSSYSDEYCSELAKYKKENIIFTGEVKGDLTKELYSNALFYVLPSEIEGMPISMLEAMSYGICPLVSDIEENMEVLNSEGNSFGFSFTSKDADSLKEKIEYMLENQEKVLRMGMAAKEYVLKKYNWDTVTESLEQAYKSIT